MTVQSNKTEIIGEVLTYNPATNSNEFLGYTDRSVHTKHGDMYYIETKTGYHITVTDDHSLATVGEDNFFAPLSPVDALGKFVPLATKLDYPVDPEVELDAINEAIKDIMRGSDTTGFKDYMMEIPPLYALPMILGMFGCEDVHTYVYACQSHDELELAKLVLARLGITPKIEGFRIVINTESKRLIPDNGKLIPEDDLIKSNPANPYLRLPYAWDEVVEVTKVPREEITYDFSVPAFPLFIGNGILVYDTMQLHVPATEGARVEALEKMLPSKNLFSPRTMTPMMLPQQESVFGLFAASKDIPNFDKNTKFTTVMDVDRIHQDIRSGVLKPNTPVMYQGIKTTAGMVLVNSVLPKHLRNYTTPWNKGVMSKILSQIGKTDAKSYTDIADAIKEYGALFSYKLGVSYKASDFDLQDLKKKRDIYFKKIDQELAAVDKQKLTPQAAEEAKGKILRKAQDFADKLTAEATDNAFHQWAYTGSKGSKSQVMQIITSPTVVADPKNRLIPMLIHKSYNEGLSPADYWVSSYGTRKGTVGAKLSVAPSGALAKELIGNVLDVVISKRDCGTRRGIQRQLSDTDNVMYRMEAGTNKFIDANYYEMLKKQGKQTVVVRSPATCEARDGVCQHCYGYNEKLKFPDIGENVGVVGAHAISEPFTQLGLSAKHTAGTAAGDAVGLNTVKSFFNMSTKFSGAAVISEVSGQVTKIEPSPAGGVNVYIGTRKKYYIPPTRKLTVKVGDTVAAGDAITDGIRNLGKVVPHKGIEHGRAAFINDISNLYQRAGIDSHKKNFEVIARGLINYVQITDPKDFDEYIEGDVVEYNQLMADIRKNPGKKAPSFVPFQKGTNKAPTYKRDWLANFGFKYLKGELIENAATHANSPLHSYHPIPSYARGIGFGRGLDGKY